MHEMSVIESLLEAVQREMQGHPQARVRAVHLRVGRLRQVSHETLRFCYEAAARGTALEGSQLMIQAVDASARCGVCSLEFEVEDNWFQCPRCHSSNGRLLRGQELDLVSIELEEPAAALS